MDSLCWNCCNAVPNPEKNCGCSWSVNFIPVQGAVIEKKKNVSQAAPLCIVKECPLFKDSRKEQKHLITQKRVLTKREEMDMLLNCPGLLPPTTY